MKHQNRVCTDVGGTFTDLVYFQMDESGHQTVTTEKADTTPPNLEEGIFEVLRRGNIDIKDVGLFTHGTTVVINALTERRGAKTALITTKGFRDVLEIARGARPDFYNLQYRKPQPFVPRYLRSEIPERMDANGNVLQPIDLAGLPDILSKFRTENVEAIAVSFLHAYANPAHEQEAVDAIKSMWPEVSVVGSHQITREWREYERSNTTVLSAYVQPLAERYLSRLETELRRHEYTGPIYIMQSNCGVDTLEHAKQAPITMVESGPASGMWGAAKLGCLIGETNIIALDIGGTTAKCALIKNGDVQIKTDYYIERDRANPGYPIMVPVVDLVEIGNGGGSIAWVNDFGKLHVGPKSAGALPGPAAYGRGGMRATTTDANLLLGRINPHYFCGGTVNADMKAVESAIGMLAERLDLPPIEVAKGIIQLADFNMVNALKLVSINKGFDPRDFALVAFGGGGGLHAVSLAQELGVKKVIIPKASGVFSAWGMMMSDLRRDQFVTKLLSLDDVPGAQAAQVLLDELVEKSRQEYRLEGIVEQNITIGRAVKLRYQNQEHAVEVQLHDSERLPADTQQIITRFHTEYERQYTYRLSAPVEMVGFHVVSTATVGALAIKYQEYGEPDASSAIKGTRMVNYAECGAYQADIYDSLRLKPGMQFSGPAVIEGPDATTVIFPENQVEIDGFGNIFIANLQAGEDRE